MIAKEREERIQPNGEGKKKKPINRPVYQKKKRKKDRGNGGKGRDGCIRGVFNLEAERVGNRHLINQIKGGLKKLE